MRNTAHLAIVVLTAICTQALVASTASATRSIEIAPNRGTFSETTTGLTLITGLTTITCEVALGGALTRTAVSKGVAQRLPEGVFAAATSSRVRGCTESGGGPANIRFLGEIPHVYGGWAGTLPAITEILVLLLRVSFLVEYSFMSCLYEEFAEAIADETGGRQEFDRMTLNPQPMTLKRGLTCPASIRASGTFTISPKWRVRLA